MKLIDVDRLIKAVKSTLPFGITSVLAIVSSLLLLSAIFLIFDSKRVLLGIFVLLCSFLVGFSAIVAYRYLKGW